MVKVFVPVSDEMLMGISSLDEHLVPFHLEYLGSLHSRARKTEMPANWISDNDYAAARKRLAECQP